MLSVLMITYTTHPVLNTRRCFPNHMRLTLLVLFAIEQQGIKFSKFDEVWKYVYMGMLITSIKLKGTSVCDDLGMGLSMCMLNAGDDFIPISAPPTTPLILTPYTCS